jgi:hypothetical protein
MLGQPGRAEAAAAETLSTYPQAPFVHAVRAVALARLGRTDESQEAVQAMRRLNPFFQPREFGTRFVSAEHYEALQAGLREAGF